MRSGKQGVSILKVVEQYRDYSPPVDIYRSLRLLLRHVPEQYLAGIYRITLTNSESLRSLYRGKLLTEKRRVRPADCLGLYGKGHIYLVIDQIFLECPEVLLLLPPLKTILIGKVLYHEIGHHIHRIEESGYGTDREAVADEWRDKLLNAFVRRRYWYLSSVVRFGAVVVRPIARTWHRRAAEERVE